MRLQCRVLEPRNYHSITMNKPNNSFIPLNAGITTRHTLSQGLMVTVTRTEQRNSVAVIIAAYNAQDTIKRAILSALAQSHVTEVIVIDDASTDGTYACASDVADPSGRLRAIKLNKNVGPSVARNTALEQTTAEWVTVLDSDDFYTEGRIERLLRFSEQYDLIADDLAQVNAEALRDEYGYLIGNNATDATSLSLDDFIRGNISKRGQSRKELGFLKPLIRRAFLEEHKLKFQPDLRLGEDYELYTRCLASGARMVLLPAQGYVSVIRPSSLSAVHTITDLRNLRDANLRILSEVRLPRSSRRLLREHYSSMNLRLQWRLFIDAKKTRNIPLALTCLVQHPSVTLHIIRNSLTHFYRPPNRVK